MSNNLKNIKVFFKKKYVLDKLILFSIFNKLEMSKERIEREEDIGLIKSDAVSS